MGTGRVNIQEYEILRILEKLNVIKITYVDIEFHVDGTVYIEVEEGMKW